jgi:hypothetical protein
MSAGLLHETVADPWFTLMRTVAVATANVSWSVGVNVTDRIWFGPAPRIVPAGGRYANVPGTELLALSWFESKRIPNGTSAGVTHDTPGTVRTNREAVSVAGAEAPSPAKST